MISEKEVLVIIPAFNEEHRIADVIKGVRTHLPGARVLVINDGSQDRTAAVSAEADALVVNHPFNLGVGTALQTGYKYAIQYGYQCVIQLDGDGQHDPSFLPQFQLALSRLQADLVIGSRFLSNPKSGASSTRRIGIIFFSKLLSLLIREKLTDPTSGYRAMKRSVLDFCIQDHYGFDYPDADFLLTLHREGFKIMEIPIEMEHRRSGQSQHRGFRPVYYVIKMLLSIFIILLRKKNIKGER